MSTSWVEKYRPKNFSEIKGQEFAINTVKRFIENFNLGKLIRKTKKALILHGAPGTGKTTIAYAVAENTNSEIFELNASDLRNKGKLQEILKPAMEQQSLVKKNKVILVDEVDGISSVDRGGLTELISLIDKTNYPVIVTANDAWDKKLASLRQKADMVPLKEIDYNTIREVLFSILRKENMFVANEIVTKIAVKAKGDLRAAINDLQTISKIPESERESIKFDERNKEIDIFNAMKFIFKGKPTEESLRIFDSVNMSMDEIILWMEENIPNEYSGRDLAKAYDRLSKVDVFKGRIYKQQHWRFLIYENALISFGISSAKSKINTGYTSYKKPSRILKMWMNNQRNSKKKTIAKKYAEKVHVGGKRAMNEFPIIKQIIKSNEDIQRELRLDDDEIAYLNQ